MVGAPQIDNRSESLRFSPALLSPACAASISPGRSTGDVEADWRLGRRFKTASISGDVTVERSRLAESCRGFSTRISCGSGQDRCSPVPGLIHRSGLLSRTTCVPGSRKAHACELSINFGRGTGDVEADWQLGRRFKNDQLVVFHSGSVGVGLWPAAASISGDVTVERSRLAGLAEDF